MCLTWSARTLGKRARRGARHGPLVRPLWREVGQDSGRCDRPGFRAPFTPMGAVRRRIRGEVCRASV